MLSKEIKKNNQNGYAILFAMVIVSIISMIAIGLSNTTYKQLILSSLANDSQLSFYQSDTATECALYADNVLNMTSDTPSPWQCGKDNSNNDFTFKISGGASDYSLNPIINVASDPCFNFNVTKLGDLPVVTNIYARGYNSGDMASKRTVEREINVSY